MVREQRARYLTLLPGATCELLTDAIVCYLYFDTRSEEEELDAWARRTWEKGSYYPVNRCEDTTPEAFFDGAEEEDRQIPASRQPLMQEGETKWSIKRNAAAAGFLREMDYLEWRRNSAADEPS